MRKLENYYRERAAQLVEQENVQKKLRVYCRYSRLPKLPTEIILQILSCFPFPKKVLKTRIPEAICVVVEGLHPFLVLKPCLELPPYCEDCRTELALAGFGMQKIDISVLADPDILWSVNLEVDIMDWRIVKEEAEILHLLLRVPHRWKDLKMFISDAESVISMLKTLGPCFQNLGRLTASSFNKAIETQSLPPSVDHVMTSSIETFEISFSLLSVFYNSGLFGSIKNLHLYEADISTFDTQSRDAYKVTISNLPRILSSLPHLEFLLIWEPCYDEDDGSPKIISDSLHRLEIRSPRDDVLIIPFLALFS